MIMKKILNISRAKDSFQRARDQLEAEIIISKAKRVVIWGAGQNGKFVLDLLNGIDIELFAFYDSKGAGNLNGVPVLAEPETINKNVFVIIAMNGPHEKVQAIRILCQSSNSNCLQIVNLEQENEEVSNKYDLSLENFVNIHKGERCFVVGNGPSLNKIDMSLLKNEICFGSNRCFIGFEEWGIQFKYWGVGDREVGGWQAEEWKKLRNMTKFIPLDMLYHTEKNDETICPVNLFRSINFQNTSPLFSTYPNILFSGRTVTYILLQLAALMGCNPIYLIGVDFGFTTNGVTIENEGAIWRQNSDDQNHFDPNYIPQGRFLAKPHWDLQELAFEGALHASKLHDFKIYNATPNSKLKVFESVSYETLFN